VGRIGGDSAGIRQDGQSKGNLTALSCTPAHVDSPSLAK
jgi:hypothetical protein